MYFLKKIFKHKDKPFYSKKANQSYESLFDFHHLKDNSNESNLVYGIIQEASDGSAYIVSGIYFDNNYINIEKDGKITNYKIKNIPGYRHLNTKNKVFDLSIENFKSIVNFTSGRKTIIKNRVRRITFLTSKGIFQTEKELDGVWGNKLLDSISTLVINIIISDNPKRAFKVFKLEQK